MIRRIALTVLLSGTAAFSQEPVCPDATSRTWLGNDSNWFATGNWSPAGVPGSDDVAYIPSVDIGGGLAFPVISGGDASVCALKMEKTGDDSPSLTLAYASGTGWGLYVGGQNALDIGADCEIHLQQGAKLNLLSPGAVTLDGNIVFKASTSSRRPTIFLPVGATILNGGGQILGEYRGRLYGPEGYEPQAWLVVGPDNALHGELQIEVGLINNGVVDPVGGLTTENITERFISLNCTPKMGSGQWNITGGSEEIKHGIYVNVDLTGTGSVTVGNYGILHVNRHISVAGGFTMEGNGKYIVPRLTLFDAHRFVKVCDFSGS